MLLSFACFAACLLIEQLPINGRNFYSTVFYVRNYMSFSYFFARKKTISFAFYFLRSVFL